MPPTSVDITKYVIGPAEIYNRDAGVLTAWTSVGLTMDDAVARIGFEHSNPSEALNGIDGSLRGLDFTKVVSAEIEFTLPELSAAKLALAIPGAVTTAGVTTDTAAPAYTATTLAAAAAIGDTSIKVTAVVGAAVGQFIRINVVAGGLAEYRQITSVGTAGAGGTGIGFRDPLLKAHASGVAVVQADGDGKTEVTPSLVRRQPLTGYKDWALVSQSPADYYEFLIFRAKSMAESIELGFTDDLTTPAGIRVMVSARKDETNLALPLVKFRVPAA